MVSYFVGDQLGSTSLTTDANGVEVGRQKYFPFGVPRVQSGTLKTDFRFTGQRSEEANFGSLYDYGARFYSPILGRFVSPDTVIPDRTNPQSLNRYTYVLNQPLNGTDPDGHCFPLCTALAGGVIGGIIGAASVALPQMIDNVRSGDPLMANIEPAEVGKAAAVGFVSGAISGATAGVGGTLLATVAVSAGTNVIAGQAAIVTDNLLSNRPAFAGTWQGGDVARDIGLGIATGALSYGANKAIKEAFRGKRADIDTLKPGPYAGESIPAEGPSRSFKSAERAEINRIGKETGCHTCGTRNPGTKSGNFVPDHQPPNSLNKGGGPQRLYPQCKNCSNRQGITLMRQSKR